VRLQLEHAAVAPLPFEEPAIPKVEGLRSTSSPSQEGQRISAELLKTIFSKSASQLRQRYS
jgi:hypothetical protein